MTLGSCRYIRQVVAPCNVARDEVCCACHYLFIRRHAGKKPKPEEDASTSESAEPVQYYNVGGIQHPSDAVTSGKYYQTLQPRPLHLVQSPTVAAYCELIPPGGRR